MATLDRQVAATDDDTRHWGNDFYDDTSTWFHVQTWTDDTIHSYRTSGARFRNITIAKDATIENGTYIEFYIWSAGGEDPNFKVYLEAIDSAPVFSDAAGLRVLDRNRTTAFASYVATGVGIGWYGAAIELKAPLQELVNRPGWVSGNDIVAILVPNTDQDGNVMLAYSWDQAGNVSGPKFHAVYSVGWTGGKFLGVANASMGKINGVALANISKVNGV